MSVLEDIAGRLKEDPSYEHLPVTTRGLLRMFNAERRGSYVVSRIKHSLKRLGLETVPDFENTWIDAPLRIKLVSKAEPVSSKAASERQGDETPDPTKPDSTGSDDEPDSTFRIGRLESVTREVVSVKPDSSIQSAVTLMMYHSFSQLPVMATPRQVKGMITWKSVGACLAMGNSVQRVSECLLPHSEVREDVSLFEALPGIIDNGYVLLRNEEGSLAGIVTVGDLSLGLRQLAEPFLLLQEIEMFIRRLLGRVPQAEFTKRSAVLLGSAAHIGIEDLSLGEYLRLLENPEFWGLLKLKLDRGNFIGELQKVRNIRNRVMHFDQDGMKSEDMQQLRNCSQFFRVLSELILYAPKGKRESRAVQ